MTEQIPALNLTGTDPAIFGWHRETTPLAAYPPKGEPVIFVIGAFSGTVAGMLIEQCPEAHHYLIEPQDWACAQLREKFGHLPNVNIRQFALGDRSGVLQMSLYGTYDCSFMRGPTPLKEVAGWGGYYDGRMVEFDECMRQERVQSIYYAKMNIEAYEYILLPHMARTGWLKRCQVIGISWHDARYNCPNPGPFSYLGEAVPVYEEMQELLARTHELVLSIDNWQTWVRRDDE
jgi:FkbM family methyltransferase